MVVIKELNTRSTQKMLHSRGYETIYCQINGKKGFIVGRNQTIDRLRNQTQFRVLIEEEHKVPIYKQAMQMQMGRTPKQKNIDRKNCLVRVLEEPNTVVSMTVWEIIQNY